MTKKEKSKDIIVVGCFAMAGPIYSVLSMISKIIWPTDDFPSEFDWGFVVYSIPFVYQFLCGIFVMKFKNWARISLIVIYIFMSLIFPWGSESSHY